MKSLTFIILAILLLPVFVDGQIVVNSQYEKNLYLAEVKQVDEFIDRFNNDEFHISIDTSKAEYKENNILSLFDIQRLQNATDSIRLVTTDFIKTVVDSNIKIRYEDTLWYAKAPCHGKLKGKQVEFTLWLNVEHRNEDMYKWVIAKAQGDIFQLTPSRVSDRIMIMPDDHETNFMSLKDITTQKVDYITNFKQKYYDLEETSVFYSLVYYGILEIDYVKDLEFLFFQVPGYVFHIKYFNRETSNSGWLIEQVDKMSDEEKLVFFNLLYNQN
ncbi:MAG: hypothetical protein IJ150_01960 [Bacteroidales bacterium]|nr:hypothetical protein [Bacteroidales bacterium]